MKLLKKLKYILILILISSVIFSEENSEKIDSSFDSAMVLKDDIGKYGEFKLRKQYEKESPDTEGEKIGISLGGGSAKGLAHIGVLKVLKEKKVPISYVSGTSMGSIVGGLYSSGYSPEEIEDIAENLDWMGLFIDKIDRKKKKIVRNLIEDRNAATMPLSRIPLGATGGNNAIKKLNELFFGVLGVKDFYDLPTSFSAVATDLNSGNGETLHNGSLPVIVRSSLSLPGVFNPIQMRVKDEESHQYKNKIYIDGGMVRNTPVGDLRFPYQKEITKKLSSKFMDSQKDDDEEQKSYFQKNTEKPYTIGVNVGAGFEDKDINKISIMDVTLDSATLYQRQESKRQDGFFADMYIAPNMQKINSYDFAKSKEIIKIGENLVKNHSDDIQAMSNPKRFDELEEKRKTFRADVEKGEGQYCYISVCAESPAELKKAKKKMTDGDIWKITSYNISSVEVRGNKKYKSDYFNKYFKNANGKMDRKAMEKITDEIYNNGNFSLVYYELEEDGDQNVGLDMKITDQVDLIKAKKYKLIINVQEKSGQYLTASLNANTENLATLSLGLQGVNSSLQYKLNGVFGEEYGVNGVGLLSLNKSGNILGLGEFEYKRDKIRNQKYFGNEYDYNNYKTKVGLGLGLTLTPNTLVTVGGGYQISDVKKSLDSSKNGKMEFPYFQASLIHDNRDAVEFPTRGTYLKADFIKGDSKKADFNTTYLRGEINIPIKKLTITPSITYVSTDGTKIPETYNPRLGGFYNTDYLVGFGGIKPDQISANSIFVGRVNIQYPIMEMNILRSSLYVNADMSVARLSDKAYRFGKKEVKSYGIGVGANIPFIGPVNLGFAKSPGESVRYVLNIGFTPKSFNGN